MDASTGNVGESRETIAGILLKLHIIFAHIK
jgi:hypothetical protein